jgi:acyl dehydratase
VETLELDSAPSLPALYARAVSVSLLPGGGGELPDRELVLRGAGLDPEHVAAYARVCGFGVRDAVPGTFPHVIAFPLQMKLMTDRAFPFSVLGLVHIANRIEVVVPIAPGSALDLRLWVENLRPHRSGKQFDMRAEATRQGETVWSGRSTYLRRGEGGGGDSAGSPDAAPPPGQAGSLRTTAMWRVPGDIGRRYAGISGDRNPIHMHALSAKAFGFPTAIAHGMWTKARCLAAFEGRLGDAYEIEVQFKAPLRIPGKARFSSGRADDSWAFALETLDGEHTHVTGAVSTA